MIKYLFYFFLLVSTIFIFSNKNTTIKENFKENNLENYFPKDEINLFKKYNKFSKIIKNREGQITITPSNLIEELPQISWNGYFINNLIVFPEYRNKGFGSKLLKNVIELSRKKGKLHLISQVKEKNIAAVKVHEKNNFKKYFIGINNKNEKVIIFVLYL